MNSKFFWRAVRIMAGLVLAVSTGALAQDPPPPVHFSGLINDYTAQVDPIAGNLGGPWEIRGEWSLDLNGASGTANFSAALNMTHSDYWIDLNPSEVDNDGPTGRNPHTHHIKMQNGTVTGITGGFEVSGPITLISGNGKGKPPLPFDCAVSTCTLTVDITGGSVVQYSNITLKFGGAPTVHFGTQAIHGFVRFPKGNESSEGD